ncbi:MAG TPA: GNAT family N-acetyltransferase [Trebonia sp.]|jgi:GNAT superfamily N-acetyltransferase|nr:GNAT family N-acetyltransferase [Trebonia sp.]
MPWVVREAVRDINRAVGRRWHAIDPLLPDPATLPAGCGEPLVVSGDHGRMAGLGVCVHQHIPPQSLNQTWGAADRFTLVPRLAGQDVAASADELLAQWRDHLAGVGAARGPDTSASVVWPSLDITGVQALLRHGLQPITVIAARSRPGSVAPPSPPRRAYGATIREAGPADEEQVIDLELRLIRYDMHFGGPVWRGATARLVREEIHGSLARNETWTWLAERNGRAVGLLVAQPPQEAGWIAGMTSRSPAGYLQTMFVDGQERGTGIGAALVRNLHARLDGMGVAVTLLHHSQVNPLSAPFWYRMGYRPLWTSWEARPATALR